MTTPVCVDPNLHSIVSSLSWRDVFPAITLAIIHAKGNFPRCRKTFPAHKYFFYLRTMKHASHKRDRYDDTINDTHKRSKNLGHSMSVSELLEYGAIKSLLRLRMSLCLARVNNGTHKTGTHKRQARRHVACYCHFCLWNKVRNVN